MGDWGGLSFFPSFVKDTTVGFCTLSNMHEKLALIFKTIFVYKYLDSMLPVYVTFMFSHSLKEIDIEKYYLMYNH